MTIPQAIMDEARKVYRESPIKVLGELEAGSLIKHLAAALLAAEQRGAERERERASLIIRRIAEILADHLSSLATPQLLNALADAIGAENAAIRNAKD